MQDREDQEGDHHGVGVEDVGVCFVEGDGVGGLDAAGEFGDAVDDADLKMVLACALGKEGNELTVMQTSTPYRAYRSGRHEHAQRDSPLFSRAVARFWNVNIREAKLRMKNCCRLMPAM